MSEQDEALVEELAECLFNATNTTPVKWHDFGYEGRKEHFSISARAILPIITAREAAAKADAEKLVEAGSKLSFAAQTTGGTAGRDDMLLDAIDEWTATLAAYREKNNG